MDQARAFLTEFSGAQGYVLFYALLAGCGIGLPLNSDLLIITASILAALGYYKLILLMPIAFAGLLTGDAINYFIARTYGKRLLRIAPFRWIVSPKKVELAEIRLRQKGSRYLFFVRFLPLIRTVLFFAAGSLQVPPRSFFLMDGLSTLLYLPALMTLAYYAGGNIDQLLAGFKQFQFVLLGLVVCSGVAILVRKSAKSSVSL